ncbi:MAG: hypothetical protein U1B83_06805 [Candidatus Cloacimonadaceae bacterium]|nr:hypothetical protein [Candidatus Cloacimonadaceae bacterium]
MKTTIILLVLLCTAMSAHAKWEFISIKNRLGLEARTDFELTDASIKAIWVPEISLKHELPRAITLQGEYSLDASYTLSRIEDSIGDTDFEQSLKLSHYRYWAGVSDPRSEARIGLQRLSFGSAQILRPLQWFDRVDPLDPNQSTKGVTALLARHYFPSSANIWLWGILANGDTKGLEFMPSPDKSLEFGGRIQHPIPNGEVGLSFHERQVEIAGTEHLPREWRAGFDARFDSFAGIWLESSVSMTDAYGTEPRNTVWSATLGADYTIGIGNGIYCLAETNLTRYERAIIAGTDDLSAVSALMISYPLGLLDNLILLNMYDYQGESSLHSLIFRRTYDYLSLELGVTSDFNTRFGGRDNRALFLGINYHL